MAGQHGNTHRYTDAYKALQRVEGISIAEMHGGTGELPACDPKRTSLILAVRDAKHAADEALAAYRASGEARAQYDAFSDDAQGPFFQAYMERSKRHTQAQQALDAYDAGQEELCLADEDGWAA